MHAACEVLALLPAAGLVERRRIHANVVELRRVGVPLGRPQAARLGLDRPGRVRRDLASGLLGVAARRDALALFGQRV
eukprot:CAMPEP_0195146444 /NCGR_PEP_ID=MMETSP0448-20130528/171639_1 /TAXON_ID=66468 /ORGANISM="Heterocapsa triquestra, Strain CCMP 448" /LENGTH=77 /DNA_ID=CAMNT_0040184995 /DNA_START=8 /DNA_END=237 /DNA_ORIENTATION=+